MYLSHVELERVGSVVLPVPQLLDLGTQPAHYGLWVGVLVELLDVLGEIVLGLLLLPADGAHAGGGRLVLLGLPAAGPVHGPQVGVLGLLGGEHFIALFTFQADWRSLGGMFRFCMI